MRIVMTKTVRPDLVFLAKPGTVLWEGEDYDAIANKHGAVTVVCRNGEKLGVKPGEFIFVCGVPKWLHEIWKEKYPETVKRVENLMGDSIDE